MVNFRMFGFLSLAFLLLTAFCLPALSLAQGNSLELGKKSFDGKCARCHGKDGTGSAKMAQLLKIPVKKINLHRAEVLKMSIFQIESMIDTGKHRMPKYRGKLTDTQIHDIATYVKFLIGNEIPREKKISK